jgi:hypothetical protein
VFFKIATLRYSADQAPLDMLHLGPYVGLNFTKQKNGVKNELIGLTCSRDIHACPVLVLIRQVRHLRANHAANDTPLFVYYNQGQAHHITDCMITK